MAVKKRAPAPEASGVKPTKDWPATTPRMVPPNSLVPDPRNAREHPEEQIETLTAIFREVGWTMPILVDEANVIIAGHGRQIMAQRLGLAKVPVITARGWSEAQKTAYRLADNQIPMMAGWDEDKLRAEVESLMGTDFDMSLVGFSDEEIAKLLHHASEADPEVTPPPPEDPVTRAGDVWRLGPHRIICGDATDPATVEKLLAGDRPKLMVTDPPYGVNYDPTWRDRLGVNKNRSKMGVVLNDDRADWREAWALFPGDVAYVWHGALHAGEVEESLRASGFAIRSQIIWSKDRFALSRGDYHWQHEPCWYAVRGKAGWVGGRSQATVWEIPAREDGGHGHGTQKPVECMKRPIVNNSRPGHMVYEPFSGSGTTIIAAEMTARICLAVEIAPAYVDVAVKRWQEFTGSTAVLDGDGRSFDDVAAERQAKAKTPKPRRRRPREQPPATP